MEKSKTLTQTDQGLAFKLVKGSFTPSETRDVLLSLIDGKINFHKLQRLRWCEGHFQADTSYADTRIAELLMEKDKVRAYVKEAMEQGHCIEISGDIQLKISKNND